MRRRNESESVMSGWRLGKKNKMLSTSNSVVTSHQGYLKLRIRGCLLRVNFISTIPSSLLAGKLNSNKSGAIARWKTIGAAARRV